MKMITEIIYGDSIEYSMLESKLNKNNIIKFNIDFSVACLSNIDDNEIHIPQCIYGEKVIYRFDKQMNELDKAVTNNNIIRVWTSHQDINSFMLLCFVTNYLKNKEVDIYTIFSDKENDDIISPACLNSNELEEMTKKEVKLSNNEKNQLSNIWNDINIKKSDMRIIENKKIKCISYDYFDRKIIELLSELGEVKAIRLAAEIMKYFYLKDTVIMFLIKRLIDQGKIVITTKENRLCDSIIKILD